MQSATEEATDPEPNKKESPDDVRSTPDGYTRTRDGRLVPIQTFSTSAYFCEIYINILKFAYSIIVLRLFLSRRYVRFVNRHTKWTAFLGLVEGTSVFFMLTGSRDKVPELLECAVAFVVHAAYSNLTGGC
jgi:hypothetical protein